MSIWASPGRFMMLGPECSFPAADVPKLYVRVAASVAGAAQTSGRLYWERDNGAAAMSTAQSQGFTITADGRYLYQLAPSTDPSSPIGSAGASILPFAVNGKTGKLTPHGASWAGAGELWVGRMGLANITFR